LVGLYDVRSRNGTGLFSQFSGARAGQSETSASAEERRVSAKHRHHNDNPVCKAHPFNNSDNNLRSSVYRQTNQPTNPGKNTTSTVQVINVTVTVPAHHNNRFTALFLGPPGSAGARRKLLLDFMVLGMITRGRHTDNPGERHSIQTNQQSTSINSPIFTPDAHPATILPIRPGLGQAQEYAGLHTP